MRILMIAPEPFFEPRGTPFSEFHRIRALTDLGHEVDLVTYPFGQNVTMPGLRVFRALRPPFVHGVKIGPSLAKLPLDALLALSVVRRAMSGSYDVVHSHEDRTRKAAASAWPSLPPSGCRICTTCTRACRSRWPTSTTARCRDWRPSSPGSSG
jgi:hypothetical protein